MTAPSGAVQIRPARIEDADAVFVLAHALAASFEVERAAFNQHFEPLTGDANADLLVAEQDGAIVGYLLGFHHLTFFANGPVGWVGRIGRSTRTGAAPALVDY